MSNYILINNGELYHYGVKGMKWGVRRYQNKDGTLTPAGKKRYRTYNEIDVNNLDRKQWRQLVNSGQDFVAKKGSELYRSTTNEYETTNGKKYVSFRSSDIAIYEDFVREGNTNPSDDVYNVTYSAKKDMKIAGARTQAELLQKMYGKNYRTDDRFKRYIENGWIDKTIMEKPISKMTDDEFGKYWYYNPFGHDTDILNKPITNKDTAKYVNELSRKGYDAVIDMLDLRIGYSDGPAVVLKSEESLERKSHYKSEY